MPSHCLMGYVVSNTQSLGKSARNYLFRAVAIENILTEIDENEENMQCKWSEWFWLVFAPLPLLSIDEK